MHENTALAKEILKTLVSFPVLPGQTNLEMIDYISDYLASHDVKAELIYSDDKTRANLFATIGPTDQGGIMLSGHTDVVAVAGQKWKTDPFELIEKNNRFYGRGAVDMKGFIACCLASVPLWKQLDLNKPIQLGITYDEECGGFGAKKLAQWLSNNSVKPAYSIVGEPTEMAIIAGHKGGFEITTSITGIEAHSCNPKNGVSAIHFAAKLINHIIDKGEQLKRIEIEDSLFDPPYSSVNIGKIAGGSSVNTIAGYCEFDWELRPLPGDDGNQILAEVDDYCQQELLSQMREQFPAANIINNIKVDVPALAINVDSPIKKLFADLTGNDRYGVVAFGTDAGYFQDVGIDSVVYGPGSINQAHKPDEYIEINEIEKCLVFLSQLHHCVNK